jgi:hypothetical protein
MPGASKPLSCLVLGLLLTGCASSPGPKLSTDQQSALTESAATENPAIQEAEDDLQHARIQRAEWMVIESAISTHPVSLGEILDLAREKQRNGDQNGATLLAQKVSRFARLGIDQALQQANAKPFYPQ